MWTGVDTTKKIAKIEKQWKSNKRENGTNVNNENRNKKWKSNKRTAIIWKKRVEKDYRKWSSTEKAFLGHYRRFSLFIADTFALLKKVNLCLVNKQKVNLCFFRSWTGFFLNDRNKYVNSVIMSEKESL